MLLGNGGRPVSHDLRHHADRQLAPLGQAAKTPPQPMQGDVVVNTRFDQCPFVVFESTLEPSGCRRGRAENPLVPLRQAPQQGGHEWRQRYGALALYLVADDDLVPLEINILPSQVCQLAGPRAGQQDALQVGSDNRVADLPNSCKPPGQLLLLQTVLPRLLFRWGLFCPGGDNARSNNLSIPGMLAAPVQECPQQAQGQPTLPWSVGNFGLDPRLHPLGVQVGKLQDHQWGERAGLAVAATFTSFLAAVLAQLAMVEQVASGPARGAVAQIVFPCFTDQNRRRRAHGLFLYPCRLGRRLRLKLALFLFPRVNALAQQEQQPRRLRPGFF